VREIGCLIADVRMSGMNGIELQRQVRGQRPSLGVIFVSAVRDRETSRLAAEGGAVRFLHKPFDPVELLRAIELAYGWDS
jgi:FixJ family two-component response regulator